MKKEAIIVLFLFAINLVSALPILNSPNQTQPYETYLGIIEGDFAQSLTRENIQIYEENRLVYFEYDLTQFNSTYYFYIIFNRVGNFTLKIKNILYNENNVVQGITLEKDIEVKKSPLIITEQINQSGNLTQLNKSYDQILLIEPGFIISIKPKITLRNKGNISINVSYLNSTIILEPQTAKEIEITPKLNFSFFNINSYKNFSIPIIYTPLNTQINITPQTQTNLKTDPTAFIIQVFEKNTTNEKLKIINFGDNNITNIIISSNLSILTLQQTKKDLFAREILEINLSVYAEIQGFFRNKIIINYTEENQTKQLEIPIEIYIFAQNSSQNLTEFPILDSSCSNLKGQLCLSGQSCNGTLTYAQGPCCIGSCYFASSTTEKSSYSWLWAIIIFIILIGAGYFVYKKIKKTQPKTPDKTIQEKSKLYENKISGGLARV